MIQKRHLKKQFKNTNDEQMAVGSFYFWEGLRKLRLEEHNFYVEQAKIRLLSNFENIEADADKYAEDYLEISGQYFNPEYHNPHDFLETSYEIGIAHYNSLNEMKKQTYLGVLAGMFHQFDKALRKWLSKEMDFLSGVGEHTKLAIWKKDFPLILDLIDNLGFEIASKDFYNSLKTCHLIINVFKHGFGQSFERLKAQRPNLFLKPIYDDFPENIRNLLLSYEMLEISAAEIDEFSNSIIEFWNYLPEHVYFDQIKAIPVWLSKALDKDEKNSS